MNFNDLSQTVSPKDFPHKVFFFILKLLCLLLEFTMPKSALISEHSKSQTITLQKKSRITVSGFPELQGTARWLEIMRRFRKDQREPCNTTAVSSDSTKLSRDEMTFPTGSKYSGTWNVLGMSGQGRYKFPNEGVVYEGDFDDGQFHGDGELIYDNGAIFRAKWNKGRITSRNLMFGNGLVYEEPDWKYCKHPDRRFTVEIDDVIMPAGRSHLVAEGPPKNIPPGMYDCGDGFFDPDSKTVYSYDDLNYIIRSPPEEEIKWSMDNCRTSPDLPKGACNFLFEEWMKPVLKLEVPPLPPCPTKNTTVGQNTSMNDFGSRSTSRLNFGMRTSRTPLQERTSTNDYFRSSSKTSHSDQVLKGNVSKANKIGFSSLHALATKSNSAVRESAGSKNSDVLWPPRITLSTSTDRVMGPKLTAKQLINW